MKSFSTLLAFPAVFASLASAVPRVVPGSHPPVFNNETGLENAVSGSVSSTNWCGIVDNAAVKSVEAQWNVPTASIPRGGDGSKTWWVYQWVGIDGYECPVILQGGTGTYIQNGKPTYFIWSEFFPAGPTLYNDFLVRPGDRVKVQAVADSATSGRMIYDNLTTGKSTTKNLQAPAGKSLCFKNVEWINEDPGNQVPFAEFTTFDFQNAKATTSGGQTVNLNGGNSWFINQGGQQLCHPSVVNSGDVKIAYH